MKILSIHKGFLADHSSTSYEFLAVDKKLDAKARSAVSRLSSRVQPTTRRASFVYHGDWSNLPGGYDALMAKYYDVMYCESYDWWTLAFAFNTNKKDLVDKLKKYSARGVEDLGVDVSYRNKRVMITVYCRMDNDVLYSYSPNGDDLWFGEDRPALSRRRLCRFGSVAGGTVLGGSWDGSSTTSASELYWDFNHKKTLRISPEGSLAGWTGHF